MCFVLKCLIISQDLCESIDIREILEIGEDYFSSDKSDFLVDNVPSDSFVSEETDTELSSKIFNIRLFVVQQL